MLITASNYTNHDLRKDSQYVSSYAFSSNGRRTHQIHYRAKYHFTQECTVEADNGQSLLKVIPQDQKLQSHSLSFIRDNQPVAIYKNKKLFDQENNLICEVLDSASITKAAVRNMLQADVDTYYFTTANKDHVLAKYQRCGLKTKYRWPLSVISKLITIITNPHKQESYKIEILSSQADIACILMVSVLLHENRNSQIGP